MNFVRYQLNNVLRTKFSLIRTQIFKYLVQYAKFKFWLTHPTQKIRMLKLVLNLNYEGFYRLKKQKQNLFFHQHRNLDKVLLNKKKQL